MAEPYIQDHLLEITVVEVVKLKDTEWIKKQDLYVSLEYGGTKFRTRIDSGGGTSPIFQEKFTFKLIQGLREINAEVWNYHSLSSDNLIGSGKIQLQGVLCQGYEDRSWTINTQSGRYVGQLKLIMHYPQANGQTMPNCVSPPAAAIPPPYINTAYPPPPAVAPPYTNAAYPPPPTAPPYAAYPPPSIVPPYTNTAYPPLPVAPPYTNTAYPPIYPPPPTTLYPPLYHPGYPYTYI